MSEVEIKDTLRGWIARKNGKLAADSIQDDTPLLEQRIVSSLHVMELVVFLERLRDAPVALEELRPGGFDSIDTIYATFFGGRR